MVDDGDDGPDGNNPEPGQGGYGFKALIYEDELDQIAGWALDHPDRETGGDLFGFWTHSSSPAVQLVLGPGPDARHEAHAFYQDAGHLARAGTALQKRHGLQHVGEWHSHHRLGLSEPSGGDKATLRAMFQRHGFERFLLVIANIRAEPGQGEEAETSWRWWPDEPLKPWRWFATTRRGRVRVELNAYLFERGVERFERGMWVVLPGASPMAKAARKEGGGQPAPRPERAWWVPRTTLAQRFEPVQRLAPPAGWYTTPEGAAFLREVDQIWRGQFEECRMALEHDRLVYGFEAGGVGFELGFARKFPNGRAVLYGPSGVVTRASPQVGAGRFARAVADAAFARVAEQEGAVGAGIHAEGEANGDGLERDAAPPVGP